ncbi:hypothetical protein RPMA_12275 [Tardiphaga alba]|uniref:Antirepressor protein C-terminal domain-containing protein n=1 Tax=Tardiphaga alba TaxID=340268 RepID=A0ABX8A797_9BRAD|nr:Rha family transcriptional regulator [Tardiphaga alba]QUS39523.1 hypothetical protein RPMA_12275 [Tardiphaga alba]
MQTLTSTTPTMSSREIAELVESRHDDVKRSIDRLVERGVIVQPPMADEPGFDTFGRSRPTKVYRLCKRDSYVVVAQLSPEFTARLVDRWQELEDAAATLAPALPDFTSPAIAARAWAEQFEARANAEAQVAEQAPKVELYERLLNADGLIGLQDAGRALLCHPNLFIRDVVIPEYCFRDGSRIVAKQTSVQRGLFENKAFTAPNDKVLLRAWMTPKGLAHFGTVRIPDHVKNPPRAAVSKPVPALTAAATAH